MAVTGSSSGRVGINRSGKRPLLSHAHAYTHLHTAQARARGTASSHPVRPACAVKVVPVLFWYCFVGEPSKIRK